VKSRQENLKQYVIDKELGCHVWQGKITYQGYGYFYDNQTRHKEAAHRMAYLEYIGPIKRGHRVKDLVVRHLCSNPPCINPKHLAVGTAKDNTNDMVRAKRIRARKPKKRYRNGRLRSGKLKTGDVREIKKYPHISARLWAEMFGVTTSTIDSVQKGRTWKHVALKA
jgi:hypothetical protein